MSKFKTVEHVIAGLLLTAIGSATAFATSTAGQAVIAQYPKLSVGVGVLLALAGAVGVYHTPAKTS